jgi:hypothetical protein
MKRRHIHDLQTSLGDAQERWQQCRDDRVAFESQMDINSCEDHLALRRLCGAEKIAESELQLAQQQLLDTQRGGFNRVRTEIARLWKWIPNALRS